MSEIAAIIPARAGSQRVPGKNLRVLNGKHLFQYAIEAALDSNLCTEVILSSDSKEILQKAKIYGDRIHLVERPAHLSGNDSTAIEYVTHALDFIKNSFDKQFDVIVIVQPSSPMTQGSDIDNTIQNMLDYNADCAVSIKELPHDLHPTKHLFFDKQKLHPLYLFSESEKESDLQQKVYVRNGSVYVSNIKLIKNAQILSDNCAAFIMPASRSVDINDELDLLFAEFLMQRSDL